MTLLLVLSYGFISPVLNLVIPGSSNNQFTDLGDVNITPDKSDTLGVALDSNFSVTTTKEVSAQELFSGIRLNRDVNFVVQKKLKNNIKLFYKAKESQILFIILK